MQRVHDGSRGVRELPTHVPCAPRARPNSCPEPRSQTHGKDVPLPRELGRGLLITDYWLLNTSHFDRGTLMQSTDAPPSIGVRFLCRVVLTVTNQSPERYCHSQGVGQAAWGECFSQPGGSRPRFRFQGCVFGCVKLFFMTKDKGVQTVVAWRWTKGWTRDSPQPLNPKPWTLNHKPYTLNPKP